MQLVKMPQLGITMKSGVISAWLKGDGDTVEAGEPLLEIESEKSIITLEAEAAGTFRTTIPVGSDVEVGGPIGAILKEGEGFDPAILNVHTHADHQETQSSAKGVPGEGELTTPSTSRRVLPRIRKLAAALDVDLDVVVATGQERAITEEDVRRVAGSSVAAGAIEPLSPTQRAMAAAVVQSWQSIPQFTQIISVRADVLVAFRDERRQITYTDIIVKALARLLKREPQYNCYYENGNRVRYDEVSVAIAIKTAYGLITPVLRATDGKSLATIHDAIADMMAAYRETPPTREQYGGAALTVSNLGMYGIETGTPILTPGQMGLVFIGAITDEPVIDQGTIRPGKILRVSLSYDHRLIDGVDGAYFSNGLRHILESPRSLNEL